MDKYETDIRIKEIRKLYKSDDFESAAQLAKDIDWTKIKTWDPLAMMIDVYEHLGDNANARDMAVLAYNRNLGGKRLVYRLTDILIKIGEMDDARELYKEYCSIARNLSDRHILNYHILRAENAPDSELIVALENYRDGEVDERYMYRLAQLYAKTGENDKCINICDDIALWFKDGEYAQGAVKLKKRIGGTLTPSQEDLYKKSKVIEEELSKTQQMTFADQLALSEARGETEIEIEEDAQSPAPGKDAAQATKESGEAAGEEAPIEDGAEVAKGVAKGAAVAGATGVFSSLIKKAFGSEEEEDLSKEGVEEGYTPTEEKDETIDNIVAGVIGDKDEATEAAEAVEEAEDVKEEQPEAAGDIPWDFNNADDEAFETTSKENAAEVQDELKEPEAEEPEEPEELTEEAVAEETAEIAENEPGEVIEEVPAKEAEAGGAAAAAVAGAAAAAGAAAVAGMAAEAGDADASEEEADEAQKGNEDPMLQENLTVGVMEILREEEALKGEGVIDEEEQIKGQLNMKDWLNEVREQRYGNQNTKEYSRSELERLLDEKDEKSRAYDKLMEEQKRLANESGKPFDEKDAKQKVEEQMIRDAARTDLAIRTGKATAKLENENKYHHGQKSVEERILTIMVDSVQEEVKKGNIKEGPNERLKRFEMSVAGAAVTPETANVSMPEKFPKEVIDAAAILVDFLTGNYDPKDVRKPDETPSVLEPEAAQVPVEEPVVPIVEESVIAAELHEVEEAPVEEVHAEEDVKEASEDINKPADEKPAEEAPAKDTEAGNASAAGAAAVAGAAAAAAGAAAVAGMAAMAGDAEAAEKEKPFEEASAEHGGFKRGKTQEITPEDIQAELEGEEIAVAARIAAPDVAADAILQRITGKVPVITPEMEKELGITPENKEKEKEEDKVAAPMEDAELSIEEEVEAHLNKQESNFSDTAHIDKKTLREIIEATPEDEKEEDVVKNTTRIFGEDGTRNTVRLDEVLKGTSIPEGKREKILSMFEEYYDYPDVNVRIEDIIAAFPKEIQNPDSTIGNIIITDNGEMDMTGLAKDISKAFGMISDKKYKAVKTTGSSLNGGIDKITSKLNGNLLIIEDATNMDPATAEGLLAFLKADKTGNRVVIEDTIERMNEFVSINKDLAKSFNHRIDMRDYTAEELVEIANEIAERRGFKIDEDGRLALYMFVKETNAGKDPITLDELDDIISDAEKRAKKRMKKNKEVGDPVITSNDFR